MLKRLRLRGCLATMGRAEIPVPGGKLSDRFSPRPDAEAMFRLFVRNANAVGKQSRTRRAPIPHLGPPIEASAEHATLAAEDPPGEVVLLTRRKAPSGFPPPDANAGGDTHRREAARVIPDVASVSPPMPPLPEKGEDGQVPAHELDRVLADMMVLLRYGHMAQVRRGLDELAQRFPEDLLLLRRIAEFHLETGDRRGSMEALFTLATRLFERKNLTGMRGALSQILVIDPNNQRARKLLGSAGGSASGSGT